MSLGLSLEKLSPQAKWEKERRLGVLAPNSPLKVITKVNVHSCCAGKWQYMFKLLHNRCHQVRNPMFRCLVSVHRFWS